MRRQHGDQWWQPAHHGAQTYNDAVSLGADTTLTA